MGRHATARVGLEQLAQAQLAVDRFMQGQLARALLAVGPRTVEGLIPGQLIATWLTLAGLPWALPVPVAAFHWGEV